MKAIYFFMAHKPRQPPSSYEILCKDWKLEKILNRCFGLCCCFNLVEITRRFIMMAMTIIIINYCNESYIMSENNYKKLIRFSSLVNFSRVGRERPFHSIINYHQHHYHYHHYHHFSIHRCWVILRGGGGMRFWPLSKGFLPILPIIMTIKHVTNQVLFA